MRIPPRSHENRVPGLLPVVLLFSFLALLAANWPVGPGMPYGAAVQPLPPIGNSGGPNISDPCTCLGNGRFAEEVVIGPAPFGQGWTVFATDLIDPQTGNPYAAGTPFQVSPVPGDTTRVYYSLPGEHIDGLGYSLTATSPDFPGQPLHIQNTCFYPEPVIESFRDPFCLFSSQVVFKGAAGGVEGQGSFFVNGQAVPTSPDPSVQEGWMATVDAGALGLGTHTLEFAFHAGNPASAGLPQNTGCRSAVTTTFRVEETPASLACNNNVQVSLNEQCLATITPDMVLEGSYLCYDDYAVSVLVNNRNIGNQVNGTYVGQTLQTRVTHLPSGNSCWGTISIEDKINPAIFCETRVVDPKTGQLWQQGDTLDVDCTISLAGIPAPLAFDNCDPAPNVRLIRESHSGEDCGKRTIVRVYRATDWQGNSSDTCALVIHIDQADYEFPDDVTWTCEQYAAFPNIVSPTALHPFICLRAAELDTFRYMCLEGTDGDDVPGLAPYQSGTSWWTDGEDLDIPLDPAYDDAIDNPLSDPDGGNCNTPSPETDARPDVMNWSLDVGCPYTTDCSLGGTHDPQLVKVPIFAPYNGAGVPLIGLEDADVLALTGSGVPNVTGTDCDFDVSFQDEKLEACTGLDTAIAFKILRTWTLVNHCTGEIITDLQIIKVSDNKPPVVDISQLETQIRVNQPGSDPHFDCRTSGLLDAPVLSDNCSGIASVRVYTPAGEGVPEYDTSGTLIGFSIPAPYLPSGTHQVRYEVIDHCGNETTRDVTIRVLDDAPPVAVCRELTQVGLSADSAGLTTVDAILFDEGSYDNCGPVWFKARRLDSNCPGIPTDRTHYKDAVTFCCGDVGTTVNVVLRVYDQDPGAGTVGESFLRDRSNECMIEVLVEDKVRPDCVAPDNVWTTCSEIPDNVDFSDPVEMSNLFGQAVAVDNCGAVAEELGPRVDLDLCGAGTVVRRFRAVDDQGNTSLGRCEQTISILPVNRYSIDIPGDFEAECTVARPDTLRYRAEGCDLLAITAEDQFFDASQLGDGACYKIIRTYQVINWCEYDGFSEPYVIARRDLNNDGRIGDGFTPNDPSGPYAASYRVLSDGNKLYLNVVDDPYTVISASSGYYLYKQHIKVFDNTPPALALPDSTVFCGGELDEDPCTGQVDISLDATDACTPDDLTFAWQLDLFADGRFDENGLGTISGRYPLGKHRVRYDVSDDCGNTSRAEFEIEVIDCKAPSPICINGFTAELMQNGTIELWASDFDASSFDYCHPIELRVNRVEDQNGDGRFTPADYISTPPPYDSIVARCQDYGILKVQLWAHELSGDGVNDWDYCVTYVDIQDNLDVCGGSRPSIGGKVADPDGRPVGNVTLDLSGINNRTYTTANDGDFTFTNLDEGYDYTLTPSRNNDYLNGVSTFDLVLISKHILNVRHLDSPYKKIAADANNSGSVSTLDLVVLRKLIMRVTDELPNTGSWRFVDRDFVFPEPWNPWATDIPEVINFNNLRRSDLEADFIAIKVGDVNGSARPNALTAIDDRSVGSFPLLVKDQFLEAGELAAVDVTAGASTPGLQFTLHYEADRAELLEIRPGLADAGNFHLFRDGKITFSWNGEVPVEGTVLFSLVFRSVTDLSVSNLLRLDGRLTPAEAYRTDGEVLRPEIVFQQSDGQTQGAVFHPVQPNPFTERAVLPFYLSASAKVEFRITDLAGREIQRISGTFAAGEQQVAISRESLNGPGLYLVTLVSPFGRASRKMVLLQ